MRLRNVAGSRDVIADSIYVVHNETAAKGNWQELFGNDHPLMLEIGMGKGQFLIEMAKRNPQINFVGVEKYSAVLLRAVQKQEQCQLANLKLIRMEAEYITDVFAPQEVAGIYLNFSDPWPKDRHAKRRLTSRQFLEKYEQVLADGAIVQFKTDNQALFAFSIEEVKEAGWACVCETWDLHSEEALCAGNVMTEYEEKFSAAGNPICMLRIRKNKE